MLLGDPGGNFELKIFWKPPEAHIYFYLFSKNLVGFVLQFSTSLHRSELRVVVISLDPFVTQQCVILYLQLINFNAALVAVLTESGQHINYTMIKIGQCIT